MTDALTRTDSPGRLFWDSSRWADMAAWHREVDRIRAEAPVLYVDDPGFLPFWALTRHADVFAVSRDDEAWSNTTRSVLGSEADQEQLDASGITPKTLIHLDGTEHRDHRAVTNDWFKPAAVKHRQPRIDDLADLFVERLRQLGGQCDFARDIAVPYTLRVIMDIYGVPEEDEPLMLELTQGIFGAADPEFLGESDDPGAKVLESVMRFIAFFNDLTEDRRACPTEDLATVIANGEVDGCPMSDDHRLWYYIIVATAGHDTTSYALAGGLEQLARDPEQLFGLQDEAAVNNAADECIRWASPVRHFLRYANGPQQVAGTEIPDGGRVLLSYPAANRDPSVFQDPHTFDVRRPDADKLLSFGVGAHFCLGAQFARREVRTMLARLSRELTHVELAGEPEWSQSHFVSGVKHLPIAYSLR
jgi:cytochrome P450